MALNAHFEDIQVNSNATAVGVSSPMNSLAVALASAAATEHDNRRRKILVERMVKDLFETLEPGTDGNDTSQLTKEQANHLSQQILGGEETGSTTIAGNFSSVTPTTKVIFNQNHALRLLWSWQVSQNRDGATEYSTCYLSIFANEGVKIDFFPPTTAPGTVPQTEEDALKIAVCDASNFQLTLEGTTKKESSSDESFEDIQIFWKLESASFSWISGSIDDIPAEEILLEAKDVSLTGKIVENVGNAGIVQLQPESVLSLKISSVGSLGLSDKEIRRVGMALRALVNFLDVLVEVPNLHLSLTDIRETSALFSRPGRTEEEAQNPAGEEEILTLGGAMRYYLKHYCNGSNNNQGGNSNQTVKTLSVAGTVSAAALAMKDRMAEAKNRTNIANLAESKERYAAVAGDAVEAATTAGKKIAGSFWGSVGNLTAGRKIGEEHQESEDTNVEPTNNSASNGGFSFGDNFRKAVARGKEATGKIVERGGEQGDRFRLGGFSRGLFASAQENVTEASTPTQQEQPPQEEQQTL
eukprot:CAMPEP_0116145842 /NCGR_PEP_ID=MMETSP0329-20121206/16839_1 /TAXON_ID=697910 /ORGANISM="Pseudo-nitzschia arenysensis, Strain B593" /LENGTH=526 /DNA_ID=CAMNT_0003641535 /DNA_START=26 /DNA_END=1606 /DNA_ORIENTATION=+